jgi:hypothetical protein
MSIVVGPTVLPPPIGQHSRSCDLMLFEEWQHSIIEQIRSCSLAIIELGKGTLL